MALITCPKGHTWDYRGKAKPGHYVCCPTCNYKFRRPFPEIVEILNEDVCIAPCQCCGKEGSLSVVMIDDGVQLLCRSCIRSSSLIYPTTQSF